MAAEVALPMPPPSRSPVPAAFRAVRGALAVAFATWSAAFIARSAVAGSDGRRYFCLFDDAMISMRYAANLAAGGGLVWNPGERVEGYTNFLWTLVMAVAARALDRSHAVLAIQVLGAGVVLGAGWAMRRLAADVAPGDAAAATVALGFALFHYPLAFWTLLGMETGLVLALSALAMAVAFAGEGRSKASAALVLLLGLACLARPDAVIVAALVLVYRRLTAGARSAAWREAAGVAVVVAAHAAFRLAYYGAIVPNTYRLKVGGVPLGFRLVNGLAYVSPWVVAGLPLIVLAAGSLWGGERRRRGLLLAAAASLLAYQVWIGGDINDLRSVLKPDATIAVFWAGTVPYYAPFRAFDLLGKSDARTAGLPPDLSGAVSWSRMRSVPGHNKYDLRYAVLRLRPTFLEHDAWGRDDVSAYVRQNYVELRTPYGRLLLLKASPSVRWEMLPRLAARR